MKLLFSLSVLLSLVSSNLAVLSSADKTTDEEKKNYIVKVTDPQAHRSLSTSSSHEILHVFKHGNLLEMRLDKAEVRELMDSDDVLDIEEDQPVYLSPTYPSSPGDMNADMDASIGENPAEVPYGIQMVQALDVADDKVGSSDITVCIADTGYDILHNDLPQGSKVVGKSFIAGQSWSVDGHGHGTHVAGTIAALEDGLGVLGVVRNGEMNLLIAKVLADTSGYGTWAGILAGVEWCQENGADVINMSLAGGGFSQINSDFYREIHEDDGVLIVAAAGNSGPGQVAYPASYDSVLSVGAIDINKNIASFSQTNDQVELVAPGVAVNSTLPNNSYASWNGTSMACPHVAGVAALIWSHFPHLTATEIRNVLRVTAENLGNDEGKDPVFGYGLVRAKDAFDALHNDDTTPVPPTPTPVPAVPPTPSLTPAGGGGGKC
jgi:serine protease